jgi:quercetin dioxygenase-like cupin family protein
MTLQVRRVVTGHNAHGSAIVTIDEITKNVVSSRPGISASVVWTTDTFPADNSGPEDGGARKVSTAHAGGTVFRVIEFAPGASPRMHRTDSIDYAVVIAGEIDMQLDDNKEVHLRAGDVLVQRGTIHNWVNRGDKPCIMAFVLIDAKPVTAAGRTLHAEG